MTAAPGRKYLTKTGVLYIIISVGGAFSAFSLLPHLPLFIFNLLFPIYYMFMGVMGIKYRNSIDKANLLRVLAIIDLITEVLGIFLIFLALSGNYDPSAGALTIAITLAIGIIIPIFYLVGAQKNLSVKQKNIMNIGSE